MAMDEEHQFILGKIDTVESKLESKMEGQFTKIGNKLEQLVELLQTVAQLQERENRNTNDIMDLRIALRDSIDMYTKTTVRIHERMDKQDHDIHSSFNSLTREISDRIEKVTTTTTLKYDTMAVTVQAIETRLNTWLNRGVGAWAAASVLLLVIQAIGGYLLTSTKDDFVALRNQVHVIEKRINDTDQHITSHTHQPHVLPQKDTRP